MANDTLTRAGKLSLSLGVIENNISVIAAAAALMRGVFVQGSRNEEEYNNACELFNVIESYAADTINELGEADGVVDEISETEINGNS